MGHNRRTKRCIGCFTIIALILFSAQVISARDSTDQMRTVKQSGFLGDYSQLHKGKEGQARLVYVNPAGDVRASDGPFKLKVSTGNYFGPQGEPVDRIFRVRTGFPRTFYVTVTNISSSSEEFYGQVASSGYSSIIFEISDETGNSNEIRRKKDPNASGAVAFTYMNPGESKVFEINLNEDEWENAFKLYKKGARRLKVRAIYENDFKRIYSDYYEVIIIDPAWKSGEKAGTKKEESSVLMSK